MAAPDRPTPVPGRDGVSALKVMPGVEIPPPPPALKPARRNAPDPAAFALGVLAGDRVQLARAITLAESDAPRHAAPAADLIQRILPSSGKSIRIGITGVPGVGKSTFIERFGIFLCEAGHRVAVLAIDPSSQVSRGSVLGDKTRMEELARHPLAFIRPSPSGGTLGGVARKTRETMLLCEAAGFDVMLIETVGVGQSEITVRQMVDFFLLLLLPGAGDELQGIKKGIVEMADGLLVTKADGDNQLRADAARSEYARATHHIQSPTPGWTPQVGMCSAVEGTGIRDLWETIQKFRETTTRSGVLEHRRADQSRAWFDALLEDGLHQWFLSRTGMAEHVDRARNEVLQGRTGITAAVHSVLERL